MDGWMERDLQRKMWSSLLGFVWTDQVTDRQTLPTCSQSSWLLTNFNDVSRSRMGRCNVAIAHLLRCVLSLRFVAPRACSLYAIDAYIISWLATTW